MPSNSRASLLHSVECVVIDFLRNSKLFVQFINMMINDSHFLVDEVFMKLPEIREIETARENVALWMSLDEVTVAVFVLHLSDFTKLRL